MDPRHLEGDHGIDRRVAVAVPADPRPPRQECGDTRRPGAGPARVAGRIRSTRTAGTGSPTGFGRSVERRVDGAVERRRHREQRLVEEDHRAADLVEWGRASGTERARAPQDRQLLAEAAAELGVLPRRQARVIEAIEEAIDAAQGDEQGAPAGLRGMRGEDGAEAQGGEARVDPGRVAPRDRGHRLRDALGKQGRGAGALPPAQLSKAMLLLREVDELEVERERIRQALPALGIEMIQPFCQPPGRGLVGALPERHEVPPRLLDEGQQLGPALLRDDLAEKRPKEPHLPRERVARSGAPDASRLAADCRVGARARRPGRARYCGWARTMIRISVMSSMA